MTDSLKTQHFVVGGEDEAVWFLPDVHVFSNYSGQGQRLRTLESLIRERMLLPQHPVYYKGVALKEAIQFKELRDIFLRHHQQKGLGELMLQRVYLPAEAKQRLLELAETHGVIEPLPEWKLTNAKELTPYQLPYDQSFGNLAGMSVPWRIVERLVREGRLGPQHTLKYEEEPARFAREFPNIAALFRETYPDYDQLIEREERRKREQQLDAKRSFKDSFAAAPQGFVPVALSDTGTGEPSPFDLPDRPPQPLVQRLFGKLTTPLLDRVAWPGLLFSWESLFATRTAMVVAGLYVAALYNYESTSPDVEVVNALVRWLSLSTLPMWTPVLLPRISGPFGLNLRTAVLSLMVAGVVGVFHTFLASIPLLLSEEHLFVEQLIGWFYQDVLFCWLSSLVWLFLAVRRRRRISYRVELQKLWEIEQIWSVLLIGFGVLGLLAQTALLARPVVPLHLRQPAELLPTEAPDAAPPAE